MGNMVKEKKYLFLEKELRDAIACKSLKPGDQLAPETELSVQYDLSLRAVRKAMLQLAKEGLVTRSRGRGSFVSESLQSDRKRVIGLVLPQINMYVNDLAGAVQRTCKEYGYKLLIEQSESRLDLEAASINSLVEEGASGILLMPVIDEAGNGNEVLFRSLCKKNYPLVFLDRYIKNLSADTVVYDNFGAIYEMTTKLIEMGYRNIFFITSAFSGMTCIAERIDAYVRVLSDNHMSFDDSFIKRLAFHKDLPEAQNELTRIVSEIKAACKGPTVMIAASDVVGLGLVRACHNSGLSLPEDISLASFGSNICELSSIPLTSVLVSPELMGREGAGILLRKLENPNHVVTRTTIPFVFQDGESCKKCNGAES